LFDLGPDTWTTLLRVADTVAVVSITFAYSLLLHVHLHLWANAQGRELNRSEHVRVYLSYVPTIFLVVTVPQLWRGDYAPMLTKLSPFVIPFAFWIAYVLGLIALTEILIARRSGNRSEKRIMRTLAASFIGIGVVIFAALGFELWQGTVAGAYLKTIANLGSLLPSALLAYYIYRYRYLEIIIEKSLVVVTFATVVLTVYVFGIRTIGDWMTRAYGVRPGLVEALLILALALLAAPLRGWLAQRFHKLFEREAALYKEILSRIGAYAGQYKDLSDLLHFVEERTTQALGLRKLKIFTEVSNSWVKDALDLSQVNGWETLEDEPLLLDHGFKLGYPMRREDKIEGLLAVDGSPSTLTTDVRSVMELLAGQVAIAIDDSRLLAENLRLERELAERERLALLGRMAATVAHEIKNPLSAIKSIAQVMREDEQLSHEYERDLRLIVGETDRLSQSVTQLLSFARKESAAEQPQTVEELLNSVVHLFQANAREQGVNLTCANRCDATLSGKCVSALRDAVSNLLLNALQATPSGGEVKLVAEAADGELLISVADSGAGVPAELRERIWEPFFTTRQRGTGLGLAIVRKRVQEVGGSASLAVSSNGRGAVFQLRLPLDSK
jgi:signal transduction histidine kinase